jgi:hypothetical protein
MLVGRSVRAGCLIAVLCAAASVRARPSAREKLGCLTYTVPVGWTRGEPYPDTQVVLRSKKTYQLGRRSAPGVLYIRQTTAEGRTIDDVERMLGALTKDQLVAFNAEVSRPEARVIDVQPHFSHVHVGSVAALRVETVSTWIIEGARLSASAVSLMAVVGDSLYVAQGDVNNDREYNRLVERFFADLRLDGCH